MINGTVSVGYLHPGDVSTCFMDSLVDLMFYDAATNQRVVANKFGKLGKQAGTGHIALDRNFLAKTVLDDSDSEWLFMVDSDMGFAPDTVDRLIESADPTKRPVVGGLAFAHRIDGASEFFGRRYRVVPTLYRMHETDDEVGFVPQFNYSRGAVSQVDATGAACMLIHYRVLQKVRDRYGDVWFDHIKVPKGKDGWTEFGEDLSFCLRLTACGIPIHVDTSVKTTHHKGGVYLDEEVYDLQQAFRQMVATELKPADG